jgi:UDP-glucose 4-epimerase
MPRHPTPEPRTVLLSGGAGYIGSHTYVALCEAGFQPVILDNFANSHTNVLERLDRIAGRRPLLEQGDVLDTAWVVAVLQRRRPMGVIHFAGENNLGGAVSLLQAMESFYLGTDAPDAPPLVFSSSASVLVIEDMLEAVRRAQPAWRMGILRYFNPVGAHPSGLIGEDPAGIPNNLMPYVAQVAVGLRPHLSVFGGDYPTPDGTGVRDYIHVQDLAAGHVAALQALLSRGDSFTVNLGTGRGYSVLEVVRAFEQASGRAVPYQVVERRPGDVAQCYADPTLARKLLGWEAKRSLEEMCADAWRWQSRNPKGYGG